MSNKTKYVLLALVLIIAAFFRFYHLTSTPPGLYMDEAMDGANAQNVVQTGQYKVYYPEDNGREGLYINILAIAFKYHILPDNAPWSVRFPAAVAGFLTVLGLYLMVSEFFKKKEGSPDSWLATHATTLALLSAFLLAISFWHINFSRIGFRAIFAPFCMVWTSFLLLKLFRAKKTAHAWLLVIAAGVIYAAGFYTYIAFRITPLLLLLFIPFFKKNKDFWKHMFLFLLVTFIVALPIGWYYLQHPADFFGRTSQISVASSGSPLATVAMNTVKTALMFNWQGDFNWRHNLSGAPQLWWPVGILFLIGLIFSIIAVIKTWKVSGKWQVASGRESQHDAAGENQNGRYLLLATCYLLLWFVIGSLPEILSNDGIPHALRSLLMVVPAVVFAAMGGVWLYEKTVGRLARDWQMAIFAFLIAAALSATYVTYFKTWAQNGNVPGSFNADYVAIGDKINALPPDWHKYVIVYAGGVTDYGIPMPAMPVMYITHSFVPNAAAQKLANNIHYLLPNELDQIPAGTPSSTIFEIR